MYLPGVYLVCSNFLYLTSHWVDPVEALPLVEVPSKARSAILSGTWKPPLETSYK